MKNQPPQKPSNPRQIRVEIPANLNATYANAVIVNQTHSEIILDFTQLMPNDLRARVQQRVVMTPANAKLFLRALEKNISNFEAKHGEIDLPAVPPTLADQLFSSIKSDDSDDDEGDK